MANNFIPAKEFCRHYQIEYAFIYSLQQSGLVQVSGPEAEPVFDEDELPNVEKMVRMHEDLGINLEGIEAIVPLLNRIEKLQDEMNGLRNRLRFFDFLE